MIVDRLIPAAARLRLAYIFPLLVCCAPRPAGFNVLLVSFDTTRADRIGCYGYHGNTTPIIDSLAARSLRFAEVYTPTPITLPAHASMLTGAYPTSHGVRSNGIFRLPENIPTLAESFRAAGYATGAFVGAFVMDSRYGLGRGFDVYDDELVSDGRRAGVLQQRERSAGTVTANALAWLKARRGDPFFAFVHYFDPHRPFEAPDDFADRYVDPYDAEIAYTDNQLGRLLAALDTLGLAENTVVAVTADHGEGLGEHGEATHANFIYNSTVRVPLVVHVPGRDDLAGAVSPAPAGLTDIAPTLASLCGVDVPAGSQGRALIPADGGTAAADRPLYLECYYPYYSHGWSPLEGVVSGGWKYVRAPSPELYDLAADPGELDNVYGEDPVRDSTYRALLEDVRRRIAPERTVRAVARPVSPEENDRLRSLGYVAGRRGAPPEDFSRLPDPKEMISTFDEYMLGVTYMADGRLDLAAQEFDRILAEDSTNYSVWEFLSETELLRGNFERAEQAALAAADAPEPTERAWFCLGMSRLARGDTLSAAELMRRTLEVNPQYGPALAVAARIADARGTHEAALEYYNRALEALPDNAELLTDVGSCLLELGRYEEAEKHLARAADIPGAGWRPSFDLGVARQLRGRFEPAAEAYRRAAADSAAPAMVYSNLGICLFSLERYDESRRAYRRALEIDPEYAEAWNNLGGSLAALGRIDDAAEAYARALELRPEYADACFNFGLLLADRLESPDSALALIERGVRLAPESPRAARMADLARELRRRTGRAH